MSEGQDTLEFVPADLTFEQVIGILDRPTIDDDVRARVLRGAAYFFRAHDMAQRARIAELEAALRPFAVFSGQLSAGTPDDAPPDIECGDPEGGWCFCREVTTGGIRRARALLGKEPAP